MISKFDYYLKIVLSVFSGAMLGLLWINPFRYFYQLFLIAYSFQGQFMVIEQQENNGPNTGFYFSRMLW